MMKKIIFSLSLLCALSACSSSSDDNAPKDMTYPEIKTEGYVPNPIDCQVYHRGDVIPVEFMLTDDTELGSYNIEIHNNFDHHTHNTSSVDCPLDDKKKAQNPWVLNKDYEIPTGQRSYKVRVDIKIPEDKDPGDYHFMLRVTDRAGWQQLHAVAIKIAE